jgi:endonuclease YncB( thermonuclease family)
MHLYPDRRSGSGLAMKRAAILLLVAACPAAAADITGRVVAVDSGDTIRLAAADGGSVTVRLSDIGAPRESAFYAPSSRQLLENIVLDKEVRVTASEAQGAERIVGHVYRGLLDVNLELVKAGAAWFCIEYANDTSYMPYQNDAIRHLRGLWSRTTTFDALVACRANPPLVGSRDLPCCASAPPAPLADDRQVFRTRIAYP